jgi:hypothetical protein
MAQTFFYQHQIKLCQYAFYVRQTSVFDYFIYAFCTAAQTLQSVKDLRSYSLTTYKASQGSRFQLFTVAHALKNLKTNQKLGRKPRYQKTMVLGWISASKKDCEQLLRFCSTKHDGPSE